MRIHSQRTNSASSFFVRSSSNLEKPQPTIEESFREVAEEVAKKNLTVRQRWGGVLGESSSQSTNGTKQPTKE